MCNSRPTTPCLCPDPVFSRRMLAGLLGPVFMFSLQAHADPYELLVSVPVSVEYDSNPGLVSTSAKGVWRTRAIPDLKLIREAGADVWNAGLGLALEQSSDTRISANRQDPSLSLGWKRLNPKGELSLNAGYEQASSRTTELTGSGLVGPDSTRTAKTLLGTWSRTLSDRASLSLDGNYRDYRYSGVGLTDYTTVGGGVTLNYAWNERVDPFVQLSATHYSPQGAGVSAANLSSAVIGVKWQAGERLTWSFQGGANHTRGTGSGGTSSNGWQGDASLHFAGERLDLSLDAGHTVSASGIGGFESANQFMGHCSYALNDKLLAGADLVVRDNQGAIPNGTRQLSLWTTRELTPFWSLRLGYLYKQLDNHAAGNASGYVIGLTLTYTHPDF